MSDLELDGRDVAICIVIAAAISAAIGIVGYLA